MTIPEDVQQRVRAEAGEHADEMLVKLSSFATEHPDLGDRMLRCLVFLAQGKLDRLEFAIKQGESDWRDTILAAECEPRPGTKRWQGDYVQVRDLRSPFA